MRDLVESLFRVNLKKGGIMMLELQNINWKTPDGKWVLKDINLKIKDNCFLAISGPNGSGKTTLAKIIVGIEQPLSGRIYLDGEDITDLDVTERAKRGISFGFQQPVSFKGITVRKMLEIASHKTLDDQGAISILRQVGLCGKEYLDRDIDSSLSGGEMKRIEIASVLARNANFAIFDEPEAGIDLWSFENLIQVFEKMRNDRKKTIVVISHQERILKTADEIVIVADGQIQVQGPSFEIIKKMTKTDCPKGELQ